MFAIYAPSLFLDLAGHADEQPPAPGVGLDDEDDPMEDEPIVIREWDEEEDFAGKFRFHNQQLALKRTTYIVGWPRIPSRANGTDWPNPRVMVITYVFRLGGSGIWRCYFSTQGTRILWRAGQLEPQLHPQRGPDCTMRHDLGAALYGEYCDPGSAATDAMSVAHDSAMAQIAEIGIAKDIATLTSYNNNENNSGIHFPTTLFFRNELTRWSDAGRRGTVEANEQWGKIRVVIHAAKFAIRSLLEATSATDEQHCGWMA